jgi:hypothetical protein
MKEGGAGFRSQRLLTCHLRERREIEGDVRRSEPGASTDSDGVADGETGGGHGEKHSIPLTEAAVREADCVVIITDHAAFDYAALDRQARLIVDTRNAMARVAERNARVVTL